MSTSIVPPPEPTLADLQQELATLKAALKAELDAERNRPTALSKAAAWFKSHKISVHVIAAAFVSAGAVVAADPSAHQAFLDLWAHVPKWGVDLVTIATPVVALYIKTTKGQAS